MMFILNESMTVNTVFFISWYKKNTKFTILFLLFLGTYSKLSKKKKTTHFANGKKLSSGELF